MADARLLEGTVGDLEIQAIIGFDGNTMGGFRVHPDRQHVVYPLGNKVSILNWTSRQQEFLNGHTNTISAIDISRSGKYIASGQINHIGFRAWVILWDFKTRTALSKHEIHKVRVEAVSFSNRDMFLLSLGGRDCGSLVIWDVALGQPLSGGAASRGIQGEATVLCTTNRRDACFITAGDGNLVMWRINKEERSVQSTDVNMSKLKRVILCMDLNERDEICFCGTSTGDILKIRLNYHHDADVLDTVKKPIMSGCYAKISRKKLPDGVVELYAQGVRALKLLPTGELFVGAGDGTVDLVEERKMKHAEFRNIAFKLPSIPELLVLRTTNVKGQVTSLQLFDENTLLIATNNCEIFSVDIKTFETKLLKTCHTSTIYSVAFPINFSEVFATSSKNDVRVWSMKTRDELLRIQVPNFSCSCVVFAFDGKSILTAWNDGIIRSFTPLTGRLIYAIMNAHNKGVSALAICSHGGTIISGGCEGQVRLWNVSPARQELMCTLKEHKGPVSAVHINHTDDEAVSASTDGTCIIWDVMRQVRKQILFANTLFMCVKYFPTGVQIMTAGSDRKVSYWEVLDGCLVRELDGSSSGALNSVDVYPNTGSLFVTGGNDQIVKLWKYQEGITTHIGLGHSAVVTAVCFSPDGNYIVSTSAAGSIFIWRVPEELKNEQTAFQSGKEDHTAKDNDADGQSDRLSIGTTKRSAKAVAPEAVPKLAINEDGRGDENIKNLQSQSNTSVSSRGSEKSGGSQSRKSVGTPKKSPSGMVCVQLKKDLCGKK